jgi:hypothetical protein
MLRPERYQRGKEQQAMDDHVERDVSTEPFYMRPSPTSRAIAPVHLARRQLTHQHVYQHSFIAILCPLICT